MYCYSGPCDCEQEFFNPSIMMYECPSCGAMWEAKGVTFGDDEDLDDEDDDF